MVEAARRDRHILPRVVIVQTLSVAIPPGAMPRQETRNRQSALRRTLNAAAACPRQAYHVRMLLMPPSPAARKRKRSARAAAEGRRVIFASERAQNIVYGARKPQRTREGISRRRAAANVRDPPAVHARLRPLSPFAHARAQIAPSEALPRCPYRGMVIKTSRCVLRVTRQVK